MTKSSDPVPRSPGSAFDPVEQQGQLFSTQAAAGPFASGPAKGAFLQTLGADPQARAIPKEDLQPVAITVGEDKPMAGGRLLLQHTLHPRVESVETLAHVHRFQGDENPRGGR